MKCKRPYIVKGLVAVRCGQCTPCRITKKREWATRLMLEAKEYENISFVTLTYSDEALYEESLITDIDEDGHIKATLEPRHPQLFIKRLRKSLAPSKIRHFYVGEYGDHGERPHYHLILFGYPSCKYGEPKLKYKNVSYEKDGPRYYEKNQCTCDSCQLIQSKWKYGFTKNERPRDVKAVGEYACGYVTKKMTNQNNEITEHWLNGRHPEFARMSNGGGKSKEGGIGSKAAKDMAQFYLTDLGQSYLQEHGDVEGTVIIAGKQLSIGSYLKDKIRNEIFTEKEILQIKANKVQELQKEAEESLYEWLEGEIPEEKLGRASIAQQLKELKIQQIIAESKQAIHNMEKRHKMFKGGNYEQFETIEREHRQRETFLQEHYRKAIAEGKERST